MLHSEIFQIYKKIFHHDAHNVEAWHHNGFGSIRIRFFNKDEWVFSYTNDNKFSIETLDNFIKNMGKNKLNGGNENEI